MRNADYLNMMQELRRISHLLAAILKELKVPIAKETQRRANRRKA